jgi:methylated-DNA-[protein]-cysteine S-methyltransferase
VLETLRREVPWGETVTYGELALMAGAPGAARAVGTTMATNPVPLVVPCHRVVASGGRIGGYGGGLHGVATKRTLLAREGLHFA